MITSLLAGLTSEQIELVEKACEEGMGSGIVNLDIYDRLDVKFIGKVRLDYDKVSTLMIVVSRELYAENTQVFSVVNGDSKFCIVDSTKNLVEFLNNTLSITLEVPNESTKTSDVLSSEEKDFFLSRISELESQLASKVTTPDNSLELLEKDKEIARLKEEISSNRSDNNISRLQSLLEAKEGTIENLHAQISELQNIKQWGIDNQYSSEEVSPYEVLVSDETIKGYLNNIDALTLELENAKKDYNNTLEKLDKLKKEFEVKQQSEASLRYSLSNAEILIDELKKSKLDSDSLNKQLSSLQKDILSYGSQIEELQSELSEKNSRIISLETDLSFEKSKPKGIDMEIYNKVVKELETYKTANDSLRLELVNANNQVLSLNKKLAKDEYIENQFGNTFTANIPARFDSPIKAMLWNNSTLSLSSNIEFIFAGSGDSIRDAYIFAKKRVKSLGSDVIFVDFSTENLSDYRFSTKITKDGFRWISGDSTLKDVTHKVNLQGTIIDLVTIGSVTYNEYTLMGYSLANKIKELDKSGCKVVVLGGVISSFLPRTIMASALTTSKVSVVSNKLATACRSMYLNSLIVSGNGSANYYTYGKVDTQANNLINIARKQGLKWEVI